MDADPLLVETGELSATLVNGMLNNLRFANHIAIDAIYPTVRDHMWRTVSPEVCQADPSRGGRLGSGQTAQWEYIYELEGKTFIWRSHLEVLTNSLRLTFNGEATSGPLTLNRLGVCILHPLEVMTRTVETVGPSGIARSTFPSHISPSRLATGFHAMRYEIGAGAVVTIATQGPLFETEDHRNWSDPGWKSYCPPLADLPLTVHTGYRTQTMITVSAKTKTDGKRPRPPAPCAEVELLPEVIGQLPRIGIATSATATIAQVMTIKELGLHYMYAEVNGSDEDTLQTITRQAEAVTMPLHIGLAVDEGTNLDAVAQRIGKQRSVAKANVFMAESLSSVPGLALDLKRRLAKAGSACHVGAGTASHFLHLNRIGAVDPGIDFVNFGLTPQTHHRDDTLVMQTVRVQRQMVRQATAKTNLPVHVSPVTLTRRDDPYDDARKHTPYLASWLIGSVAALASGPAAFVTYFAIDGYDGLVQRDEGTRQPPALRVLSLLAQRASKPVYGCNLPEREIAVVAVDDAVLVANLTATPRAVTVRGLQQRRRTFDLEPFGHTILDR